MPIKQNFNMNCISCYDKTSVLPLFGIFGVFDSRWISNVYFNVGPILHYMVYGLQA